MIDQTLKLITIDGPAASGKSSIGKILAGKLAWPWVSTGVFYRGLALFCLERSVLDPKGLVQGQDFPVFPERGPVQGPTGSLAFPEKGISAKLTTLVSLASDPCWEIRMDEEETRVFINGKNRTEEISSEEVALVASDVSRIPQVREALLKPQRDCFNPEMGLVAEGRDCGTVVFPEARVKIYLTAREDTRARRRHQQQKGDLVRTLEIQKLRDGQDSRRQTAPLKVPQGAFIIDSTLLGVEEVVEQILDHVQTHGLFP